MNRDLNERMTELEIHLVHVQRMYDQLNEVVTSQAMEADRMQRRITQLQTQIKELKEKPVSQADPLDEKPPHY